MRIGIPKEKNEKETRVAIVPVSVPKLSKLGFEVIIEKNAGKKSGYSNAEYEEKGAKISSIDDVMKSELIFSARIDPMPLAVFPASLCANGRLVWLQFHLLTCACG